MPSSKEVAWAAGLFEGEGCFSKNNNYSITAQLNMTDEDVVRKFHNIVKVGNVTGPYYGQNSTKRKNYHKQFWYWKVSKFEYVQYIMALFWNFLGERRKTKITELLTWHKEKYALKQIV